MRPRYAMSVQASVTRGGRCGPPIDGCARNWRKNAIAVGGIVAAGQSASQRHSPEPVAIWMKLQSCHAETTKVNVENETYVRSVRFRRMTDAPIARMTSAASSAETACTSTDEE